jgi:hypothetical protein
MMHARISKVAKILEYCRDGFSQVLGRHQIERSWPKRFHDCFKMIEYVVHRQAEPKMVNTAMAIVLDVDRRQIRAVLEQQRAGHH